MPTMALGDNLALEVVLFVVASKVDVGDRVAAGVTVGAIATAEDEVGSTT